MLTPTQIGEFLDGIGGDEPLTLRDRALFELIYSCGLRAQEALDLTVQDIDVGRREARVKGKGRKVRVVPVGEDALSAVDRYLRVARPGLLARAHAGAPAATAAATRSTQRSADRVETSFRESPRATAQPLGRPPAPGTASGPGVRAGGHLPAHAAALVRHTPAGGRGRPRFIQETAGSRLARHHPGLHPRLRRPPAQGLPNAHPRA